MLERIANSRTFLSFVLAGMTGLFLFFFYPFPQGNLYLQYIALKDPLVYSVLARSYTLFLFTTPFFIYSTALSGVYVLSFRRKRKQKANSLPRIPIRVPGTIYFSWSEKFITQQESVVEPTLNG